MVFNSPSLVFQSSIWQHKSIISAYFQRYTKYLKRRNKNQAQEQKQKQKQIKSQNQSSRNIHHKVTMHAKCLPVQRFGEKVSMLQVQPHMNDSKLTVRYIPPSSTKVPTAESPSTSLRSAFAQMRPYGPACACAYVSGVSNRCAGPAGSSSESQKTASGWARVRAISSSCARSVNVLDTPGGCSLDLDLVTAGVTRYRCCCSGPGEDDRTTRWSCCPFVNDAATVPGPDPRRKWFHHRWTFLLPVSAGPSPKSQQPLRRSPPTVPAPAAATAAVAVYSPLLPRHRPRLSLSAAAAVAAAAALADVPPPRHRPRPSLNAAAAAVAATATLGRGVQDPASER